MDNYHPYVLEEYVPLSEGGDSVAVKIIHDTGATQSLKAFHALPLFEQTFVAASVLIQGVYRKIFLRVLLHQIHLQSNLISGLVVVGVRPSLTVKVVPLILSKHLVGGKLQLLLQVVSDTEQILCLPSAVDGGIF